MRAVTAGTKGNIERTVTKLIGFYAAICFVAFVYWVFPEYSKPFYTNYFNLINKVLIPWMVLAIPYFYYTDMCMQKPNDEYWRLGRLIIAGDGQGWALIIQLLIGWLVKLYFFALMFSYLGGNLIQITKNTNFNIILDHANLFFDFAIFFLFFTDVIISSSGYACTFKIFNTHIRSVDQTCSGWLSALICYEPFWY